MASQNTTVYDNQIAHNTTRNAGQSMLPLQSTLRIFKVRHTLTSAMTNTQILKLGLPKLRNAKLLPHLSRLSVVGATGFNASVTLNKVPDDTGTAAALTAATACNNTNPSVAFTGVSGFDTPTLGINDSITAVVSSVTTAAIGDVLEFELVFDVSGQP